MRPRLGSKRGARPRKAVPNAPAFLVLDDGAARALLARNHIGRIAFVAQGRIEIEPVSYAADGDWIYARSAHGAKLEALAHSPYVAFEIDEVEGPYDWQSIVVHGTVYAVSEAGSKIDKSRFEQALGALRSFAPETLTPADPTPFRDVVYGIHIDRLTGRKATTKGRTPRRPHATTRRKA